jgi:hypothetical protein
LNGGGRLDRLDTLSRRQGHGRHHSNHQPGATFAKLNEGGVESLTRSLALGPRQNQSAG